MMKRTLLCLLLVLSLLGTITVAAAEDSCPLVCDDANLLSASEESKLLSRLEELSRSTGLDIVVITVNSIGVKTPAQFADDFYDYNGYGQGPDRDGLILLVSMEDRDWYISTCGYAIRAFTNAGIDYIGEKITPYLSDGEYADAFNEFADQCEAFVAQARTGDPYDTHNLPKEPFGFLFAAFIALVIGLLIALIYTGILRGQLKSVRQQAGASEYVRSGSLDIRIMKDLFLYRTIRRTPKPSGGSSTHRSSSGRSHGGGGGKF